MTIDIISTTDNFNQAMTLWFELTGMDPNAKSWRGLQQIELMGLNEELKMSMAYDPTLVTTYLLLDAFSQDYFKDAKISVAEFDDDEDKVFDYMSKVREFKRLIRNPEITQVADSFLEATRRALLHYGVSADIIEPFLADRANLAFIRRDALKSIHRLKASQFLKGETDPETVKPVYNKTIFGYWNINSMIEHVCAMPSGMSMNLIRDPDELHSYFAIAVRNGGNLLFLTDSTEYAHPLGRSMSRRPDKAFDARVCKNWFPYQLLAIKYDANGDPFHDRWTEAKGRDIVAHQPKHYEVAKMVDLEAAQIVWTTLLFDLIYEKYWKQPMPVLELSYTNEMIRLEDQHTLLTAAAQANLPVTGYQPLNLPRLTPADVMTDTLDEAAIGERHADWQNRYGAKRWMEERYGHLIPEDALNLIGVADNAHMFLQYHPEKEVEKRWSKDEPANIVPIGDGGVKRITTEGDNYFAQREPFRDLDTSSNPIYALEKVDSTLFGTRAEIDADRKFIARVNFASGLQREADREFASERGNVLRWFEDRIKANVDRLIAYAHYSGVEKARTRYATFGGGWLDGDNADKTVERYDFATLHDLTRKLESYEYSRWNHDWTTNLHQGWQHPGFYKCYLTGAKSSWQLYLQPGGPQELAFITDTKVEDLPPYLQNWNPGDDHYLGNSILQRIDPLEWKLDNPWDKISFAVSIFLSKRGLAQVRKTQPAPALEDVSHIKHKGISRQNGRGRRSRVDHSNYKSADYISGKES